MIYSTLLFSLLVGGGFQPELPDPETFLKPGDTIWVGHGMAKGYNLPFGKKLTVKKIRIMFRLEARLFFEGSNRKYYLRTDFSDNYAFREDPRQKYSFTPEEWYTMRQGTITEGMSKELFLCIRRRAPEIHYQTNPAGPVEQWIYRDNPTSMYGMGVENPPTAIYYFQNDQLIHIL